MMSHTPYHNWIRLCLWREPQLIPLWLVYIDAMPVWPCLCNYYTCIYRICWSICRSFIVPIFVTVMITFITGTSFLLLLSLLLSLVHLKFGILISRIISRTSTEDDWSLQACLLMLFTWCEVKMSGDARRWLSAWATPWATPLHSSWSSDKEWQQKHWNGVWSKW